jgi:tetratricopeptide (TPR) repeat protein
MTRSLAVIACLAFIGCPDRAMDRAAELAKKGDTRGAAIAFKQIARSDPANLAAWDQAIDLFCRELADVGECLNVLDLELELLGKVDRHRDVLGEVLERRARSRLDSGMIDAALEDVTRGLKVAPDRAAFEVLRARALLAKGDREAAKGALERAHKLDPKNPEAAQIVNELLPQDEPFGGSP